MSITDKILIRILNNIPFRSYFLNMFRHSNIVKNISSLVPYTGEFYVEVDGGKFLLNSTGIESLENELFWLGVDGIKEKLSLNIWVELSKLSNVILDIGANTGMYGLSSNCVNNKANIFCFEPQKKAFVKLENNIKLNKATSVSAEKIAASDRNGMSLFFDVETSNFYSASLNKESVPKEMDNISYEVETCRLDDFLERNSISNVDLIKIDVELHEFEVLNGLKKTITRCMPTILIEVLNEEVAEQLNTIILDYDYLVFDFQSKPVLLEKIKKASAWNLLLCSRSVALSLGLIKC